MNMCVTQTEEAFAFQIQSFSIYLLISAAVGELQRAGLILI